VKQAAKTQQKTGKANGQPSPKRGAILDAATRVFLGASYGAASMDAIAREAGVSKQTVYSHFGAKNVLYGAVIHEKCSQLMAPLLTAEHHGAAPEKALLGVATRFLKLILAEGNMAHYRAVVAESGRFPELAEAYYMAGPKKAVENLADYLSHMDGEGSLKVADPLGSARLFFAMLRGDLYMRRLLRMAPEPTCGGIEAAAGQAVGVFLDAHAPK